MTEPSPERPAQHAQSRSLVTNSSVLVASRIITAVFGWAGTVVIARTLSPEDWGQYAFVFGLLGIMALITDLGVGRVVLARLAADDHDDSSCSGYFSAPSGSPSPSPTQH